MRRLLTVMVVAAGKLKLFRVQKVSVEEVQDFGRVICPQGKTYRAIEK